MLESPNRLIKFWQELKRRKTGKVIVAYAATAFILLQLADILTPALLLPEWATRLVTLILIIGFPISVIFSWVFDITPEGIKRTELIEESENKETVRKSTKRIFTVSNIIIAALIIVVGILAYPKIFKQDTLEKLRSSGKKISVGVMPFQNLTGDTTKNFWQEMIQDNLITYLSNSPEELTVRQTESISRLIQSSGLTNYSSMTPSLASNISQKLDANVFIYGRIKEISSTIRVNAQLTDSKTQEVFKSFQIDGTAENILLMVDSLSKMVTNFLIVSILEKEINPDFQRFASTNSPEAYRYYIYGNDAFFKRDYFTAMNMYLQALTSDSNFVYAAIMLSMSNRNQGELLEALNLYDEAKKWCLKVYQKRDQMSMQQKILTNWAYAINFETPYEVIKYGKQLLRIDDQLPRFYYNIGWCYNLLYQYDRAIPEFERALSIYKKWRSKPNWVYNYAGLGFAYHETNQFKKEKKLYKKAEKDFPDDYILSYRQAILSFAMGDTLRANDYINKYISLQKERSASEAEIKTGLALTYTAAGIPERAEEYYSQALSLEPQNPVRINNLAYFLIDKDRNNKKGMELVDSGLELDPGNYNYLHTKGWGLYKQGKYQEALEVLQKSWDIRRVKAIYNHDASLHLEAAKKAVAGQKNN